jgi:hypothetical protein
LGSQDTPTRGWNIFQSEGMFPSEGKAKVPRLFVTVLPMNPLKKTWSAGVMTSGSCSPSQRRPYWMVRPRLGCHLSWMKRARLFCGMLWVPASSTLRPPTPACCRYRSTGPLMLEPAGHWPFWEVLPFEHST